MQAKHSCKKWQGHEFEFESESVWSLAYSTAKEELPFTKLISNNTDEKEQVECYPLLLP